MKKILHISNDDKFICLGKKIFDSVKHTINDYWIFSQSDGFEYINFDAKNLSNIDINTPEYHDTVNSYDLICIHFLNPSLYPLLNSKKIRKPILWIGWGGDYYWLLDTYQDFELFLPKTKKWFNNLSHNDKLTPIIKILKKIKRKSLFTMVNQIDYFSTVNKYEYSLIKKNYPKFAPTFVEWNYGYLTKEIIDYYSSVKRDGEKVMIGNSATPTNNHLDILADLSSTLKNEEIILPLSYGDKKYAAFIQKKATDLFGDKVRTLNEFINNQEFDKILLSCSALIIGSFRQQAVGTIITALYLGVNVFLYENSLNYLFFKEHGFYLNTIEELMQNPDLLHKQFTKDELDDNRGKINEIWSLERNANTISQILKKLDSK